MLPCPCRCACLPAARRCHYRCSMAWGPAPPSRVAPGGWSTWRLSVRATPRRPALCGGGAWPVQLCIAPLGQRETRGCVRALRCAPLAAACGCFCSFFRGSCALLLRFVQGGNALLFAACGCSVGGGCLCFSCSGLVPLPALSSLTHLVRSVSHPLGHLCAGHCGYQTVFFLFVSSNLGPLSTHRPAIVYRSCRATPHFSVQRGTYALRSGSSSSGLRRSGV